MRSLTAAFLLPFVGSFISTVSAAAVSQVGDGQVEHPPSEVGYRIVDARDDHPVTQVGDGQVEHPPEKRDITPVTQIGDGQVEHPPSKRQDLPPLTQISDGQIPPKAKRSHIALPKRVAGVTQVGDGQVTPPSKRDITPVTQYGDGQVPSPPSKRNTFNESQLGDGQIQAPPMTKRNNPLLPRVAADPSQVGDGQIRAPPQSTRYSVDEPQITPPPRNPAFHKRQAAPVTMEVDNVDSIVTTTDGLSEPMPSGSHIRMISNSDGSLDLLMGPDLQAQVQQTLESSCAADQGEGCQTAIHDTLQQADFGVQARGILISALSLGGIATVGVETAGIGLLLLSFGYVISHIWAGDQSVPARINLPADDAAQVTSGGDATNVVVSTAGGQPTTLNSPSITVSAPVSTSSNDAHDLIVEFVDDETLQWLITESQNESECFHPALVKRQGLTCNVLHGQNAMNNLAAMPLANLLLLPYIPAPSAQDLQAAAQGIFDAGRNLAALAQLPDESLWNVANFLAMIYSEPSGQDPTNTMTIPASDIATQDATTTTQSTSSTSTPSSACPTDETTPACVDDNCQGDPEAEQTCTVDNELASCSCAPIKDSEYHTDGDMAWLQTQADAVDQALLNAEDDSTPGNCSARITAWLTAPTGEMQGDIGLGVTLYNEYGEEVPYGAWSGGIDFGASGGTGGLGPDVTWTIGDYVANNFVEIYFGYNGQEWRLSSCPADDTEDIDYLERTCQFSCGG